MLQMVSNIVFGQCAFSDLFGLCTSYLTSTPLFSVEVLRTIQEVPNHFQQILLLGIPESQKSNMLEIAGSNFVRFDLENNFNFEMSPKLDSVCGRVPGRIFSPSVPRLRGGGVKGVQFSNFLMFP